MRNAPAIELFFATEVNDYVRSLLLRHLHATDAEGVVELNLNRFNVYLDFATRTARVEDVLDTSDTGVGALGFQEFRALLEGAQ